MSNIQDNTSTTCGHPGINWNGEGDCITCARDKVLEVDNISDLNETLKSVQVSEGDMNTLTELREILEAAAETYETEDGEYLAVDIEQALQLISSYTKEQRKLAKQELVQEFQTVAIPETDEYANGWNDCRKRVRKDLNRLAELENNHV